MLRALGRKWRHVVTSSLLAATLASTGCASIPVAYPGPRRAPSEVARLRAERGRITSVDGVAYFAKELEILPGEREVTVSYLLRGEDFAPGVRAEEVARFDCRCRGMLIAGRRYRLEIERSLPIGRISSAVIRYVHRVRLADDADGRFLFLDSECAWRR